MLKMVEDKTQLHDHYFKQKIEINDNNVVSFDTKLKPSEEVLKEFESMDGYSIKFWYKDECVGSYFEKEEPGSETSDSKKHEILHLDKLDNVYFT